MRKTWLTATLAFSTALQIPDASLAQDQLDPIEEKRGILADYDQLLREVFSEAQEEDVVAAAKILPSFTPEVTILIRRRDDSYRVVTLIATAHLWRYKAARGDPRILRGMPADPMDVEIDRCERPLTSNAATLVVDAWHAMLDRVRPLREAPGVDGVTYEFRVIGTDGAKQGSINSPRDGRTVTLVNLANMLLDFCQNEAQAEDLATLAKTISATS